MGWGGKGQEREREREKESASSRNALFRAIDHRQNLRPLNLRFPFILDCIPTSSPPEVLSHHRKERSGCTRTWRRIYITPLQIVNAVGFGNKICTAVPSSSHALVARVGEQGGKSDKGRWRGQKETPTTMMVVVVQVITWVCCAKGVRDRVEGRDLRGRADE